MTEEFTRPTHILPRFHHNSHQHKLFQTITRDISIFCDNVNCARRILNGEVSYVCFKCNFDLCAHCFMLPTDESSVVQLAPDDKIINEDVLFKASRYNTFAEKVRIDKDASARAVNNEDGVSSFNVHIQQQEQNEDDEEEFVPMDDDNDGEDELTSVDVEPTTSIPQQRLVQPTAENKEDVEDQPVQIRLSNPNYDTQTNASVNHLLSTVQPRIRMRRSLRTPRQQVEEKSQPSEQGNRPLRRRQ